MICKGLRLWSSIHGFMTNVSFLCHQTGLSMSNHVAAVCRAAYFQLRQIRMIARSLTADAAKTLIQAFITCRLDYCNSLFCGITDNLFRCLQSVQNAAARLITGTRRSDHITPVLRELHWLPVRQRVDFKLAVLVYKALHDLTAPYLMDDCQLITSNAGRRSCGRRILTFASSLEQTPVSVTEILRSLVHVSGTVCQRNCVSQTLNWKNFDGY